MQLAPDVSIARVGEEIIVLDLARDRYLALGARLGAAMADLLERDEPDPDLQPYCDRLVSSGLLVPGRAAWRPNLPCAPRSATTLWPLNRHDSASAQGAGVHLALGQVWLRLRASPFRGTLRWIGRQPVRASPREALEAVVGRFFGVRPWFPVKPICRLDALALYLCLVRSGHPASLIFGVMSEPVAAHCWVEASGMVINEPHEMAARYTPILRLGGS